MLLAIQEIQIASKYLAIHDHQTAIAHLTMKVRQIPINASNYLDIHDRHHVSFFIVLRSYVCKIIDKRT
jgi:hypothetical protein